MYNMLDRDDMNKKINLFWKKNTIHDYDDNDWYNAVYKDRNRRIGGWVIRTTQSVTQL